MTPEKRDDDFERRLRDVLHDRALGLPVEPDAIEHIHAGARRRQLRRNAASSLGAVAVIAIAAAGIALRAQGHSSTVAANLRTTSPSSSDVAPSSPPPAASASPPGSPSALASTVIVAPPGSAVASTPPVRVFNPVSVSAVGVNEYWVLGYTTASSGPDGVTMMKTTDAGQHFAKVGSPSAFVGQMGTPVPLGTPTVSDIRFGDTNNGWAYGASLFATTDSGTSWAPVTDVPGNVVDLAAASGNVWAVSDIVTNGTDSHSLYHATYGTTGTSAWAKVKLGSTSFDNVVVIKKTAYLLASAGPTQQGIFVTITNGGNAVASRPGPC
ncbi:MAG: hypothetical protein QOG69_2414, partial [Actinomycetota bacterium]|nr:hypothetical protein [Actinomycetota bacterium]